MSQHDQPITTPALPQPVLTVLHAATTGHLLDDTASLAAGLAQAGWVRDVLGGQWTCPATKGWTLVSFAQSPHIGLFAHGERAVIIGARQTLTHHLTSCGPGPLFPDPPEPHWPTWRTKDVIISLNTSTFPRPLPPGQLTELTDPRSLHVALARADEPAEGFVPDPERARHLARHGTPVQRWYLASQEDLNEDVVAVLAKDPDPAVVAALAAAADSRDGFRRWNAEDAEDAEDAASYLR